MVKRNGYLKMSRIQGRMEEASSHARKRELVHVVARGLADKAVLVSVDPFLRGPSRMS